MTNAEETTRSFPLLEKALHDRKSGPMEVSCDICGARLKSYTIMRNEDEDVYRRQVELVERLTFVCGRTASRVRDRSERQELPDGPFCLALWGHAQAWTADDTCENASWMVKNLLAERAKAQKTNQQPSTGHESR